MTRRDKCHLVGKRAGMLNDAQAVIAWKCLALDLDALGETDLPKFKHLLRAIRAATIAASRR
jgi:hypothetical protein